MIQEDVRFMNEEAEGLKQCPCWERPITVDFLEENWNFILRRQFCQKFRGDTKNIIIVSEWANKNKELIDEEKSEYWTEQDLAENL